MFKKRKKELKKGTFSVLKKKKPEHLTVFKRCET